MKLRSANYLVLSILISNALSCGYALQTSSNPVLAEKGIRKLYVRPFQNDSFKPGIETIVFNAVVKRIATHAQVKIVQSLEDADGVLTGGVSNAAYATEAQTTADALRPLGTGPSKIYVAASYSASLSCGFSLSDRKTGASIWSSGFSRNKSFSANNQLGVYGTTSTLINDSEFDRAIVDLADGIAGDMHESMFSMF